jgi:hypothetical protein
MQILAIDGIRLGLEVFVWRDVQPGGPAASGPLVATVRVSSEEQSLAISQGISVELVEVTYGSEQWTERLTEEETRAIPSRAVLTARGGPNWPAGATIDVTVLLRDSSGDQRVMKLEGISIRAVE